MQLGYRTLTSSAQRCARTVALGRAIDPVLESLESRRLYAVTANAAGGLLSVVGDDNANAIVISRDAAGNLLVRNGGAAIAITGSPATVGTIQQINVRGFGGDDSLTLSESAGVLPKASLSGGTGNDTLSGGAGADTLNGDSGNDVLFGQAGNDTLNGGGDNDTLIGGVGTDAAFGQSGNDRLIWNPGEGSDLNEGGDGTDTIEVNGAAASESFTVVGVGNRVLFRRVTPTEFTLDIGASEKLILNAGDGDDTFAGGNALAGLMSFTVNGGAGDDTLQGTDGADRLDGGDGSDFLDGNAGADVARLGAGDDFFVWDPGDGSDVVEGQGGFDRMIFNGSGGNEAFDLSNNAGRLRLFRDAGNITMDVNDVEAVQLQARGGADTVTVHDLRGTDVRVLDLSLADSVGGDGQLDSVLVEGTSNADRMLISGSATAAIAVNGLATAIAITNQEATDKLQVRSGAGNDVVDASGLDGGVVLLTLDGRSGNDVLVGSRGNDTLFGGDGEDILIGGPGEDSLDGGAGDDIRVQ